MTTQEYLEKVLEDQRLADDSDEMKELRQHREDVEAVILEAFGDFKPTIRYGGSKAKGTLIRESYDLDLVCYFPSGETGAGDSLEDIFNNVKDVLANHYHTEAKTSAIRLKSKDAVWDDFHIDVVPGRFTDDDKKDCYLYQNGAEKCRLKTNLQVHIDHIRDAGVTPALRLLKLWRSRRAIGVKNFIWELLCIQLLINMKNSTLEEQVKHGLQTVADSQDAISIEDPANPSGNDLMEFLDNHWWQLSAAASDTLALAESGGWAAVFGSIDEASKSNDTDRLAAVAVSTGTRTQPWSH